MFVHSRIVRAIVALALVAVGLIAGTSTASSATRQPSAVASGPNLFPYGDFEVFDAATNQPAGMTRSLWGANTPCNLQVGADPAAPDSSSNSFEGGRGGSVCLSSVAGEGAADWFPGLVPLQPNRIYLFSGWYASTVETAMSAWVTTTGGLDKYPYIGALPASPGGDWAPFAGTFTAPADTVAGTAYLPLQKVGQLSVDNLSLTEVDSGLSTGSYTVDLDDGFKSQYRNAYPVLHSLGVHANWFIISRALIAKYPEYMTIKQVQYLHKHGQVVGGHTANHWHLPQLTPAQLNREVVDSKRAEEKVLGFKLSHFAYPYGEYNDAVKALCAKLYRTCRGVDSGFNSRVDNDAFTGRVFNVFSTTTVAEVQDALTVAATNHLNVRFVFHRVVAHPGLYDVTPAQFRQFIGLMKASGLPNYTANQLANQLG